MIKSDSKTKLADGKTLLQRVRQVERAQGKLDDSVTPWIEQIERDDFSAHPVVVYCWLMGVKVTNYPPGNCQIIVDNKGINAAHMAAVWLQSKGWLKSALRAYKVPSLTFAGLKDFEYSGGEK